MKDRRNVTYKDLAYAYFSRDLKFCVEKGICIVTDVRDGRREGINLIEPSETSFLIADCDPFQAYDNRISYAGHNAFCREKHLLGYYFSRLGEVL